MPKRGNAEPLGYSITKQGYRMLTMRYDHPLAAANGTVLEHRKVLYDEIGAGPHPCHWGCCKQLAWPEIFVDHLDDDGLNNDPPNLVVSCFSDNIHRTRYEASLGRVCELCGDVFYAKGMCRRHYNQSRPRRRR